MRDLSNIRFPRNISKSVREAGKVSASEKFTATALVSFIINIFLFSPMQTLVAMVHLPSFCGIILQILLTAFVGIIIVRRFVIREDDKLAEQNSSKSSSLSNYYYIRDKDNTERIESMPIYEFTDGNYTTFIKLTFGDSSDRRAENTRVFLTNVYQEVLKAEMQISTYVMPEDFSQSIECKRYVNSLAKIKYPQLSKAMLAIYKNDLEVCSKFSSLFTIVLQIRTKTPYQIMNFDTIIRKIIDSYTKDENSLRGLEFMEKEELRAFLRDYYCLDALDLSGLRLVSVSKDLLMKYKDLIKITEYETSLNDVVKKSDITFSTDAKKFR